MKKKQIGLIIALAFLGILTVFPFYLTIVNSLKYNLQIIESIWFLICRFILTIMYGRQKKLWEEYLIPFYIRL